MAGPPSILGRVRSVPAPVILYPTYRRQLNRTAPQGKAEDQLTPSLRCKLEDDVVYWKVSFLSG
jgi:hypothetical protein